ncbi:cytochrome P450 6g1-like [Lutzomyia longipalpis]|uniref:cytochrome P450 6g1-like n=1 Tax=Lutzomyia longipalpis TaxID=7200 RepID=UPI002483B10B|nr:cytochrome P450 6g1-like [Lutzomyia longipalpis]
MFVLGVTAVLILCIVAFLIWWQKSARLYWEKNGVSYIPGPPLIGIPKDCMMLKKNCGELFMEIYNNEKFKDEPITGVYFFNKPSLVVRHPELIKKILIKDFSNFMDRTLSGDPYHDVIGMDNLFLVKGQRWKTIRHKLSPIFTTGKVKNFFLLMMEVIKILEQKLAEEIGDEPQEYDAKELASLYTTDTLSLCAFGVQANSLLDPKADIHENIKRAIDFNWQRGLVYLLSFFLPKLSSVFGLILFSKETNDFLRSTINNVMEERIKSGIKRNDLIDTLIAMNKEDSDLYKGDTLVAQAAIFLAAGYETSSSAISFALYELAQNPEVQEKLRQEINSYIEKYGSVQYETIHEMEYLHYVVQETLRLYPNLTFLDRNCTPTDGKSSYSLEPYHKFAIPRGMPVYIPAMAIQRDPNYFPDPLKFIPERFESKSSLHQSNFLSFGIGPRECIGKRFAYFQVKLSLVTILRHYKVEASERTPKTIKLDRKAVVLRSEEPLYINLSRI